MDQIAYRRIQKIYDLKPQSFLATEVTEDTEIFILPQKGAKDTKKFLTLIARITLKLKKLLDTDLRINDCRFASVIYD
jgi:hypothetical protein